MSVRLSLEGIDSSNTVTLSMVQLRDNVADSRALRISAASSSEEGPGPSELATIVTRAILGKSTPVLERYPGHLRLSLSWPQIS